MTSKLLRFFSLILFLAGGCIQPPARLRSNTDIKVLLPSPTPLLYTVPTTITVTQTELPNTQPPPHQTELPTSSQPKTPDPQQFNFTACEQLICYTPFQGALSIPVPPGDHQTVEPSYRYGTTQNGERIPHDGAEFYTAYGSPVLAAADGIVFYAGDDKAKAWGRFTNFYGELVILEHNLVGFPQPIYTLYAHLSKRSVKTGETVQIGQQIGEVGASGGAIGSHLHFEVRVGSPNLENIQNPEIYLGLAPDPNQKTGILFGRISKDLNIEPGQIVVIQSIQNEIIQTEHALYLETYAAGIPTHPALNENFGISNLPIGKYRISTFIDGQFIESYFVIKENILTDITLNLEDE